MVRTFTYMGEKLYSRKTKEGGRILFFAEKPREWGLPLANIPPGYIIRETEFDIPCVIEIGLKCPKCGSHQIDVIGPVRPGVNRSGKVEYLCQKCRHTFYGARW